MDNELTARQAEILQVIRDHIAENGLPALAARSSRSCSASPPPTASSSTSMRSRRRAPSSSCPMPRAASA